jgi:diacylglycerol kinase
MKDLPGKNPQKQEEAGKSSPPPPSACSVPERICVDLDGDGVYETNTPENPSGDEVYETSPQNNREKDHHPDHIANGKNRKYDAKNYLQSQQFAVDGLKLIYLNERNFRIQLVFTALVIIAGLVLNISHQDWVALALVIALVLVTEAFNSVVEAICDTISKEYRINIKYAKDVSAGAVLLSAILSLVAGVIIFSPYIWELLILLIEGRT